MAKISPVILCIMDGWGLSADDHHNAVAQAHTPIFDQLTATWPTSQLCASETAVGLPKGQPGNSEVGHMTIGAGRMFMQDLPRISAACAQGRLAEMPPLQHFAEQLVRTGGSAHLVGLTSTGGVHSHSDHLLALARSLTAMKVPVWIHIITDGRDTLPKAARDSLPPFIAAIPEGCRIASVTGRYFAMDRDKRWERTQAFYDLLTAGKAAYHADDAQAALKAGYARNESDEFISATGLDGYQGTEAQDGILLANFRVDRMRQIARALYAPQMTGIKSAVKRAESGPESGPVWGTESGPGLSLTPIAEDITPFMPYMFSAPDLSGGLGEIVAKAGYRQLRLAETEKYPHVTFFFNGGLEQQYKNEDRELVASPAVATYDLQPEMSASDLLDKALLAIRQGNHHLIIINFANPDMVGHTGDLQAAIKAVETVDMAVGQLVEAVINAQGAMLITADHGNCEVMWDEAAKSPHTAHTTNPVPCVLVEGTSRSKAQKLRNGGLIDLAPTLLDLLGLDVPPVMTGTSLIAEKQTKT